MVKIENKLKSKLLSFYDLIKASYPVKYLLLYGSYSKGNQTKDSDIDVAVVLDLPDHSKRIEIGADLFNKAGKVDYLIEPKCIFLDEYLNAEKASILAEIKRTAIRII